MAIVFETFPNSPLGTYSRNTACDSSGLNIVVATDNTGVSVSNNRGSSFSLKNFPIVGNHNQYPFFISSDGMKIYTFIINEEPTYPNAIYYSVDGGITVNQTIQSIYPAFSGSNPVIYTNLTGLYMIVASNLYPGQGDGKTYTSSTGSGGLTLTDLPLTNRCVGVSCSSAGKYSCAIQDDGTGNGGIYYSSNGINFTQVLSQVSTSPVSNLTGNKNTGQYVFCSIFDGGIYYSSDYGANWLLSDAPTEQYLIVSCDSTGQYVYCITLSSAIYRSINYGQNWTITNAPLLNWRNIKSSLSGENVIARVDTDTTYSSSNYGLDWYEVTTLSPANYQYYSAAASTTSFFVPFTNGEGQLAGTPPPPPPPVICFKEGSTILSLVDNVEKYIPIQDIRKGTLVKTIKHGYVPVNMIGTSKVYNSGDTLRSNNKLFLCSKDKYPELTEDLIITGAHSILVDNLTDKQKENIIEELGRLMVTDGKYRLMAVYDERAKPYEIDGVFNIWHLALDNDNYFMNYGVYANGGLLVETASQRMMKEYSGMQIL